MSKTTTTLVVFIVILIITGAIIKTIQINQPDPPLQIIKSNTEIIKNNTEVKKGDNKLIKFLNNLLSSKENQKCLVKANMQNIPVKGIVYSSGENIRGDFEPEFSLIDLSGHIIINPENVYAWTDQSEDGYIYPLSNISGLTAKNNIPDEINNSLETSCSRWVLDKSVFILPGNIKFSTENMLLP